MKDMTRKQKVDESIFGSHGRNLGGRKLAFSSDSVGVAVSRGNSDIALMDSAEFSIADDGSAVVLALADGMGSTSSGDVASLLAARLVVETFESGGYGGNVNERLRGAIDNANRAVLSAPESGIGERGMCTTIVAGVLADGILRYGHAGDSRAMLFRRGYVHRLTRDHLVGVVDKGASDANFKATANDNDIAIAAYHYIGDARVIAEFGKIEVYPGDVLVFASDGVTEYVTEPEIWKLLKRSSPPRAAEKLVDQAVRSRSHDHCSAIVVRI